MLKKIVGMFKSRLFVIILALIIILVVAGSLVFFKDMREGLVGTLKHTVIDTTNGVTSFIGVGSIEQESIEDDELELSNEGYDESSEVNQEQDSNTETKKSLDEYNLHVYVLDTLGDAVIIKEGQKVVLLNGGFPSDKDKIVQQLRDLGVERLDYMVGLNYHESSYGGLVGVLDYFPVSHIILAENIVHYDKGKELVDKIASKNLTWIAANNGTKIKLEKAQITLIKTHKFGSVLASLRNGVNTFLFSGTTTLFKDVIESDLPREVDFYSVNSVNKKYILPTKILNNVEVANFLVGNNHSNKEKYLSELSKEVIDSIYTTESCGVIILGSDGVDADILSSCKPTEIMDNNNF